jgi:hypothetical protein
MTGTWHNAMEERVNPSNKTGLSSIRDVDNTKEIILRCNKTAKVNVNVVSIIE